jgi:hypothetical protein
VSNLEPICLPFYKEEKHLLYKHLFFCICSVLLSSGCSTISKNQPNEPLSRLPILEIKNSPSHPISPSKVNREWDLDFVTATAAHHTPNVQNQEIHSLFYSIVADSQRAHEKSAAREIAESEKIIAERMLKKGHMNKLDYFRIEIFYLEALSQEEETQRVLNSEKEKLVLLMGEQNAELENKIPKILPPLPEKLTENELKNFELVTKYKIALRYQNQIVPLRKKILDETMLRYNGMLISVFDLLTESREAIKSTEESIQATRDFWICSSNTR